MKQEISKFPSFNHSGKEHIINTFTSKECDKPAENKDERSKTNYVNASKGTDNTENVTDL